MRSDQLTIGRVRLRDRGLDGLSARLRMEQMLAGVDLEPSGLPHGATLCVRRLADPLPGALVLQPDAALPQAWKRALAAQLDLVLRRAVRPARDAVPAGADAVLFADRAELLACLARDASDGLVHALWWWRGLERSAEHVGSSPSASLADSVAAAWLAEPEHVPAALEMLTSAREAERLMALFPVAVALELVERIAVAFGLAGVRAALAAPARRQYAARSSKRRHAPWRAVAPEAAGGSLVPEHELLMGLSLVLRRAPEHARTAGFAAAVSDWREATIGVQPSGEPPEGAGELSRRQTQRDPASTSALAAPDQQPADSIWPKRRKRADGSEVTAESRAGARRPSGSLGPQSGPSGPVPTASRPGMRWHLVELEQSNPSEPANEGARRTRRAPAPGPELGASLTSTSQPTAIQAITPMPESAMVLETQLGGAFYLVNLALFLDLYADFTRPLEPGIALNPWDLVALLTAELIGTEARTDPLWRLLAHLAGRRRDEPPGRGFHPPSAWRIPTPWLEPFKPGSEWRWSAARRTLRIVHPEGFAVVAVPRTVASPERQLAHELRRLGPAVPSLRRTSLGREPSVPLRRWSTRLAAYVEARLRRAMGLERGETPGELVLRHRARVHVTATRVDVTLSLAQLPVAIRLAGLDRNPGWLPAAGRFLELHFR